MEDSASTDGALEQLLLSSVCCCILDTDAHARPQVVQLSLVVPVELRESGMRAAPLANRPWVLWHNEQNGADFLCERLKFVIAFCAEGAPRKKQRFACSAAAAGSGGDVNIGRDCAAPLQLQSAPGGCYTQFATEIQARVLSHLLQTYALTWADDYFQEIRKEPQLRDEVVFQLGAILACCATTVKVDPKS